MPVVARNADGHMYLLASPYPTKAETQGRFLIQRDEATRVDTFPDGDPVWFCDLPDLRKHERPAHTPCDQPAVSKARRGDEPVYLFLLAGPGPTRQLAGSPPYRRARAQRPRRHRVPLPPGEPASGKALDWEAACPTIGPILCNGL